MKNKLDLKGSLQLALLTVAYNLFFSLVTVLLIYGWLLPNLALISPRISDWYYSGDLPMLQATLDVIYHVGNVFSMIPATYFAYRSIRNRRREFLKITKGLISYEGGLGLHKENYGFSDSVVCAAVMLIFTLAALIAGVGPWLGVFPLAYTLFSLFGNVLGPIIGLVPAIAIECAAIPIGVFLAQKKWRALYFIGE